jgi:hypothetical protein
LLAYRHSLYESVKVSRHVYHRCTLRGTLEIGIASSLLCLRYKIPPVHFPALGFNNYEYRNRCHHHMLIHCVLRQTHLQGNACTGEGVVTTTIVSVTITRLSDVELRLIGFALACPSPSPLLGVEVACPVLVNAGLVYPTCAEEVVAAAVPVGVAYVMGVVVSKSSSLGRGPLAVPSTACIIACQSV